MRKHHSKNEVMKHQYAAFLEEAKRMSPSTVDQTMATIALFEETTGCRDFAAFHIEQARKFKRRMDEAIHPDTGRLAVWRAPCDFAYGANWQLNQQCMVSNLGDPGPRNDPTTLGKDRCTCLLFPSIGDSFIRPEHKFHFQLDWFIFSAPDNVPG
jgi:hypothetical protein